MKGKQVIITGATLGIGKEIAMQLGALGADLVLASRNIERGKHTADAIKQQTGAKQVDVMLIDTSSQASIREFAQQYRKKYSRLDVLINNAGMNRGMHPRAKSVDGIELTFATNVIGYFMLTQELLDMLIASEPSRIVNVASQFASDLDLDDLEFERRPFESFKAYAQSKACNRLFTWALARRLKGTQVATNAMAPGLIVDTGLYRNAPPELVARLRQRSDRTVTQGADTAVWLASSPDVESVSGKFFYDRKKVPCEFRKKADEEKLWTICEGLIQAA
jgi:NAD(P)-dependent dehydrogenase (short-subunit alcohol dehydrogenase family)